MNSNRCFSLLSVALLLVVLVTGVGGAVTVTEEEVPAAARVGAQVSTTFDFDDLYRNPSMESWTLRGTTELRNVTWTVERADQAGSVIDQRSYDGPTFRHSIDIETGTAAVTVRLTGTVPPIQNFSYSPAPTFRFARFEQTRSGGSSRTIRMDETRHFTSESQTARTAIESAQAAIDDAGGHQAASEILANAISAYEVQNFDNAVDLANRAEQQASSTRQRNQLLQYGLFGVLGLLVLVAVFGGVYWYRQQGRGGTL